MEKEITPRDILLLAFPGIEEHQADEIASAGRRKTYPPDTILCREGSYEKVFYIVLSGCVHVIKRINLKQKRILKQLGPGSFFGEMAILHNAPRTATVKTVTTTTVLEIHKDQFDGMLEQSNDVSLAIVREVSSRLRENDEMAIEDLQVKANRLSEAYQKLLEEEYTRSVFLSTVLQEARNPLSAANRTICSMRSERLQGEEAEQALDSVYHNLQELTVLTNQLLFLQEMDLLMLDFVPVDAAALIQAAVEQEQNFAARMGVSVCLEIPPGLPCFPGDARNLQCALGAVINNAIKFSPNGGEVLVKASCIDGQICIAVQDHGVGIPPEAVARIFDRYFHLDKVSEHVFHGIGLGLPIAKKIIDLHRGKIEVQSEIRTGSTFTIFLPIEAN
ncbi:MAG: cyclic nucleotide-binding domain-containing protein [Chloroflexi bacterium]|nr:cyclic nucleotide-binding domain-containing protein [Chloroflexota bacterium]